MNNAIIFQYVSSIIECQSLNRLIRRASKSANIILDFEDSIQDVLEEKKTSLLKKQARNNLRLLLNVHSDLEVGVRINHLNSSEYKNDIILLSELKHVKWSYIVLPKIESYYEIKQILVDLLSIRYQEIIICIESDTGLNNLHSTLKNINSKNISKIQFGHFDYFFDRGIFPIPEQTSPVFWETCESLIKQVEELGFTYLHTPINVLNSKSLTNSIVNKLKKTCENEFGFATVSMIQNELLLYYKESEAKPLLMKSNNINKTIYANEIINCFSKNKSNFSFQHKNQDRIFIPPQEYYAAKLFLSNI